MSLVPLTRTTRLLLLILDVSLYLIDHREGKVGRSVFSQPRLGVAYVSPIPGNLARSASKGGP